MPRIPVWDKLVQPHGIIKSSLITYGLRHSVSRFAQVAFVHKLPVLKSSALTPCGWIINSIVCFLVAVKKTRQKQTAVSYHVLEQCERGGLVISSHNPVSTIIRWLFFSLTNPCVPLCGTLVFFFSGPRGILYFFEAKKLRRRVSKSKTSAKRIVCFCF